jgi:hypothetical protein
VALSFCWLQRELGMWTCSGRLTRAHLIPKRRMKAEGMSHDDIWDPRIWRWICLAHHNRLDNPGTRPLYIERDQYPDSVVEWAAEHGFYFAGKEAGWRKENR